MTQAARAAVASSSGSVGMDDLRSSGGLLADRGGDGPTGLNERTPFDQVVRDCTSALDVAISLLRRCSDVDVPAVMTAMPHLQPSSSTSKSYIDQAPAEPMTGSKPEASSLSDAAKAAVRRWRDGAHEVNQEMVGVLETHPAVVVMDILFIAAAFVMPILALASLHFRSTFTENPTNITRLYVGNVGMQVFTMAWVALQFFVQRKDGWTMITTLRQIRWFYLKRRFLFDLLFAVPIEFLFIGWNFNAFSWLCMRHFIRLLRMFDITLSSNPLLGRRTLMQFGAIMSVSAFVCSAFAAAFWALEPNYDFVDSLYWLFATIVTTGYGDIVATQRNTKIYSIFVILVGLALISAVSAWATKLLTEKDRLTARMDDNKEMLHSMFEHYEVPWDLRREVINLVPTLLEKQSTKDFQVTLSKLPPFVAKRIEVYSTAKFIKSVPLFATISDSQVLLGLSKRMRRRFVPAGEVIVTSGDIPREMYFLQRGLVQVMEHQFVNQAGQVVEATSADVASVKEEIVEYAKEGSFFGEDGMRTPPKPSKRTYMTLQLVELIVLTRSGFEELRALPEFESVFKVDVFKEERKISFASLLAGDDADPSSSTALPRNAAAGKTLVSDDVEVADP